MSAAKSICFCAGDGTLDRHCHGAERRLPCSRPGDCVTQLSIEAIPGRWHGSSGEESRRSEKKGRGVCGRGCGCGCRWFATCRRAAACRPWRRHHRCGVPPRQARCNQRCMSRCGTSGWGQRWRRHSVDLVPRPVTHARHGGATLSCIRSPRLPPGAQPQCCTFPGTSPTGGDRACCG